MSNKDSSVINVPTYIEKAIKKLFKTEETKKELVNQIKDYMETHNIPSNTPLTLLKHYPEEEIIEGQMQLEVE